MSNEKEVTTWVMGLMDDVDNWTNSWALRMEGQLFYEPLLTMADRGYYPSSKSLWIARDSYGTGDTQILLDGWWTRIKFNYKFITIKKHLEARSEARLLQYRQENKEKTLAALSKLQSDIEPKG
jgi:hypothetical protein